MLILITSRCRMGCTHCMSDCRPEGEDMSYSTFTDAIDFNLRRAFPTPIMLSGGEPTENPQFQQMVGYTLQAMEEQKIEIPFLILTNGIWLTEHTEFLDSIEAQHMKWPQFQVVIDDRYYPQHVNEDILRNYSCVKLCYGVDHIYPQGRAKENNLPGNYTASKCFNIRAVVKQLQPSTYEDIVTQFSIPRVKLCSPFIDMDGNIRLGESLLCPVCSSIYKKDSEIIEDIRTFKCSGCDFLNGKLDPLYKQFL